MAGPYPAQLSRKVCFPNAAVGIDPLAAGGQMTGPSAGNGPRRPCIGACLAPGIAAAWRRRSFNQWAASAATVSCGVPRRHATSQQDYLSTLGSKRGRGHGAPPPPCVLWTSMCTGGTETSDQRAKAYKERSHPTLDHGHSTTQG
eukprot:365535-Chlamydomonas_euryale.AAC.27